MKTRSVIRPIRRLLFFSLVCAFASVNALALAENDRNYSLERIGYLKSWDNVDGLFAQYVDEAYESFFEQDSRFKLRDLEPGIKVLEKSSIPYRELVNDPKVLLQVARKARVDSIVRTKVVREGPRYRFEMEWLHFPKAHLIGKHSFQIQEPEKGKAIEIDELKSKIRKELGTLIAKVPFIAQVSGRDKDWVTVNVGKTSGVQPGDEMTVQSLDEVKVHPILNTIVEWRFERTGRLIVDEVDDSVAFCKVLEEEPGRQITKFQKVTKIIHKPKAEIPSKAMVKETSSNTPSFEPPRLGFFGGKLLGGIASRQYSPAGSEAQSGLLLGGIAEGELWLTESIFVNAEFGYGFYSLTAGSASLLRLGGSLGYRYLVGPHLIGPSASVRLGYLLNGHSIGTDGTGLVGPASFGSVYVGLGGELPLRDRWGVSLDFTIGVINSAGVDEFITAESAGTASMSLWIGGYYWWDQKIRIRAGVQVDSHSADFAGGANLTHRTIAFAPALLYYF